MTIREAIETGAISCINCGNFRLHKYNGRYRMRCKLKLLLKDVKNGGRGEEPVLPYRRYLADPLPQELQLNPVKICIPLGEFDDMRGGK